MERVDNSDNLGRLRDLIGGVNWSILPSVRRGWNWRGGMIEGGRESIWREDYLGAKEVVWALAEVVARVRVEKGVKCPFELEGLRDYVYERWSPVEAGDEVMASLLSAEALQERESVIEDFRVGDWTVRWWENARPMMARCDSSKAMSKMVRDYGYPRILFELSGVPDVLARMVGFKFLGILEPDKGWGEFIGSLGLWGNYVFDRLEWVVGEVNKRMDDNGMHLVDKKWLRTVMAKMYSDWGDFGWQKLLKEGSQIRAEVAGWTKGKTGEEKMVIWRQGGLWEKLSLDERRVLAAAAVISGEPKNDCRLAEDLEMGYTTFKATLKRVLLVGRGEERRWVGTDHLPFVRRSNFPLSLILLSESCRKEWLKDGLNPLQREIWEFVTVPTVDGYYHTWDEVEAKFGSRCSLYVYAKKLAETVRRIMEDNGETVVRQKNFGVK